MLCEGCVLGKQTGLSFGTRVKDVKTAGDLIHTNVSRPMQEASFQGFQ